MHWYFSANEFAEIVTKRSGHDVTASWVEHQVEVGTLPNRSQGHGRPSLFTEDDIEKGVMLAVLRKNGVSGQRIRKVFGDREEATVDDATRKALLFAEKVGTLRKRGLDSDTALARATDMFGGLWEARNEFLNRPHGNIVDAEGLRAAFHKAESVLMGDMEPDAEACPDEAISLLAKCQFLTGAELRKVNEVRDAASTSDFAAVLKAAPAVRVGWHDVEVYRTGTNGPAKITDMREIGSLLDAFRRGILPEGYEVRVHTEVVAALDVDWSGFTDSRAAGFYGGGF